MDNTIPYQYPVPAHVLYVALPWVQHLKNTAPGVHVLLNLLYSYVAVQAYQFIAWAVESKVAQGSSYLPGTGFATGAHKGHHTLYMYTGSHCHTALTTQAAF